MKNFWFLSISSVTSFIQLFYKIPDIFNLTEREGMLSSRCILNMKRLVILKYKQRPQKKVHKATWKFADNLNE